MSDGYNGARTPDVPLNPAQIKAAGDPQYVRIDASNRPLHVFPNALINASFDHWQRGAGPFSLSGAGRLFGPDRCEIQNLGPNGSVTVTRVPLAYGDYASRSRLSAVFACTGHSAAGDGALISERIEGVDSFAGGRVVVAQGLRLASGAAGSKVVIELVRNYGTGGSAEEYIYVGVVTLTSVMLRTGIPVDVPSMSGKVIGTANDYLAVNIWLSAGTNYQARVQGQIGLQAIGVQITDRECKEIRSGYGDQYPGFERVPKYFDYVNCLRFYEKSYDVGVTPGTSGLGAEQGENRVALNGADFYDYGSIFFKVEKRINPAMLGYNCLTGSGNYWDLSSNNLNGNITFSTTNPKRSRVWNNQNSWGVNHVMNFCWVAIAEF